jgi:predicted component of type VI protein secretion system
MPYLIIQTGKHRGKKLILPESERVVVGRDESCQIQLGSTDVSRQHCVLRPTPEGIYIRDLGSRNGTLVNNAAIKVETLLQPGDLVQIGPMVFRVPAKKDAPAAPPAADAAKKPSAKTTDDDIANWLAGDEELEGGLSPADTTIVTNREAAPEAAPLPETAAFKPAKKAFDSIAEEAADIIRRHWESKGGPPK